MFEQGVWFVSLAPISDPNLVSSTIAQALGVREAGGRPILELLKSYLREKRTLLLLDNFEQMVGAAPLISELLAAAPGLKVLVTSRTTLRLSGEHEYTVPPLGLPPLHDHRRPTTDDAHGGVVGGRSSAVTQYEAVRLFIERAQAARADFAVTNENAPAVAEICHRLDGLPLAIELAAARIKLFPPQALLMRLDKRLKFLTGGARDSPARQQTIRNTIDWSYQLLDDAEKTLFARLGVFVGGSLIEAVEVVCNADGDLPFDVIDGVAALVDKSLLRQPEESDGEPRFVMLETIREYALERLAASGEAERLQLLHARYYRDLAQAAVPGFRGMEQLAWIERIEVEHGNLRAALTWSQASREGAEIGLQLAGALGWFWYMRGYWSEGRAWLMDALTGIGGADRSSARAQALTSAGHLSYHLGDYATAQTMLEESVMLCRELGDQQGLAYALLYMANVPGSLGDYALCRILLEESVALCRELGDKEVIALLLNGRGEMARSVGDYTQAAVWYDQCLTLERELGNQGRIANVLHNLGHTMLHQGDLLRALKSFMESLTLRQELGDKRGIVYVLAGLRGLAGAQGQPERATPLLGASAALFEHLDVHLERVDQFEFDSNLTVVRTQLDEASFAAAWAAGSALTLDEAIAEALRDS